MQRYTLSPGRRAFWAVAISCLCLAYGTSSVHAGGQRWQLHILPASLHHNRAIHLVAGYLQPMAVMMQAKLPEPRDTYRVELEIDLPPGMRIEHMSGRYQFSRQATYVREGRVTAAFAFVIRHTDIAGEPGSRLHSLWKNQHFFVRVPNDVPLKQAYLRTTLRHEDVEVTERWPLVIHDLPELRMKPQRTRVALWDYGLNLAGLAAEPLGRFLAAAGINHIQAAGDAHAAFAQHGITSGGYVHHSVFAHREHPAVDVRGNQKRGGFASSQAVIDSRGQVIELGIKALAAQAAQQDGMATIDFEPSPLHGFSPSAIRAFKQRYRVAHADVERLRQYMVVHQRQSHLVTHPVLKQVYAKWVAFRTWQSAQYMRIMASRLKAHNPAYRLEVTAHSSYSNAYRALSLGYNAAALAPHVDGILPQLYHGYGGAAAKLVMTVTSRWRQQTDMPLYPVLLVQFLGAKVRNSPQRLHQHIMGALAEGANGVFLYYTQVMDGRYWRQLAQTAHDIALTEPFYQQGQRVRDALVAEHMPQSRSRVELWPSDHVMVEHTQWHYTVHYRDGHYLLTLFNLRESDSLTFNFSTRKLFRMLRARGLTSHRQVRQTMAFTLPPQGVGFVTLQAYSQ